MGHPWCRDMTMCEPGTQRRRLANAPAFLATAVRLVARAPSRAWLNTPSGKDSLLAGQHTRLAESGATSSGVCPLIRAR